MFRTAHAVVWVLFLLCGMVLIDTCYAMDGVKLGGRCAVCGKWVPASEDATHPCWKQRSTQSGNGDSWDSGTDWRLRQQQKREREQEERWRRAAEERRRKLEELKEAEEKSARLAEEAEQQFIQEKEDALRSLKGNTGILEIKGSEKRKPFGIQATPDVELEIPEKDTSRGPTAWAQLYRGAWISGFAMEAATPPPGETIDIEEVRYLAEQAAIAMNGGKIAVQCPEVPAPPSPYGQADLGPDSAALKFYKTLLPMVEKESETAHQAEQQIWEGKIKQQKVNRDVAKKKKAVERIENEIKELAVKPVLSASEVEQEKNTEAKEKKRALEAALKALNQAEKTLRDVNQSLADTEKQLAGSKTNLANFESMYNTVQTEPTKASEYLETMEKQGTGP